jgi:hypothetical protein
VSDPTSNTATSTQDFNRGRNGNLTPASPSRLCSRPKQVLIQQTLTRDSGKKQCMSATTAAPIVRVNVGLRLDRAQTFFEGLVKGLLRCETSCVRLLPLIPSIWKARYMPISAFRTISHWPPPPISNPCVCSIAWLVFVVPARNKPVSSQEWKIFLVSRVRTDLPMSRHCILIMINKISRSCSTNVSEYRSAFARCVDLEFCAHLSDSIWEIP